eukprot:jgi/Botrbrau1/5658/Bobra.0071s0004.1
MEYLNPRMTCRKTFCEIVRQGRANEFVSVGRNVNNTVNSTFTSWEQWWIVLINQSATRDPCTGGQFSSQLQGVPTFDVLSANGACAFNFTLYYCVYCEVAPIQSVCGIQRPPPAPRSAALPLPPADEPTTAATDLQKPPSKLPSNPLDQRICRHTHNGAGDRRGAESTCQSSRSAGLRSGSFWYRQRRRGREPCDHAGIGARKRRDTHQRHVGPIKELSVSRCDDHAGMIPAQAYSAAASSLQFSNHFWLNFFFSLWRTVGGYPCLACL